MNTTVLFQMDMNLMFSQSANFSELLNTKQNLTVTKVVHKALIEVNEEGTEAAAATGAEASTFSMETYFNADHPFLFAILNGDGIFFSGRVVKFWMCNKSAMFIGIFWILSIFLLNEQCFSVLFISNIVM